MMANLHSLRAMDYYVYFESMRNETRTRDKFVDLVESAEQI